MPNLYRNTAAAVLAAAFCATGCAVSPNGPQEALTVQQTHPISVDSQTVTLTLAIDDAQNGLSPLDAARVRGIADAYMRNGHGPLSISAPSGVSGRTADAVAGRVRTALYEAGVPEAAINVATYPQGAPVRSDLIISFTRYTATASACGIWVGLANADSRNIRSPNFGCATQNNLAAMVADPRDLVEPAGMTPPDSASRIRAVRAYREGSVTSSETDGAIQSQVAN